MAPTDNEMTVSQFEAVDAAHPAALIGFLEAGKATPGLRAAKAVLLEELRLRPGQAVLDAGCGYGQDTADLAALVAPPATRSASTPARRCSPRPAGAPPPWSTSRRSSTAT